MSCKLQKNEKNGKINKVLNQAGKPSKLFQQIFNTPTLTLNQAIDAYKNIYSEKLKDTVKFSIGQKGISIQEAVKRNNGNPLNLAPNGKPSILYQSYKDLGYSDSEAERLTAQTFSDEFQNWFGDWINAANSFFDGDILDRKEAIKTFNSSYVVDSNMQPAVMYHGTPSSDITEFDRNKKVRKSSGLREVANYFTSNIKLAELYKKAEVDEEYRNSVKKEITKLKELQYNVRNNRDYDSIENKIKLSQDKLSGTIYSTFLNVKEPFLENGRGLDERAWNNFRLPIGYKTASNKADILDALSGKNDAARLDTNYDGAIVSNIADMASGKSLFTTEESSLDEVREDVKPYIGTVVAVWEPNQIKSATENIGTFGSESNDIRYQILGEKGAQNLDQIEEATFRMDNLLVAKEMEQVGKTPLQIRLSTGWEKNSMDLKWRYEILDGNIKPLTNLKPNLNIKGIGYVFVTNVEEIFNNEELFKAYPNLKQTEVVLMMSDNEAFRDYKMFFSNDKIYINLNYYGNTTALGIDTRNDFIHELQHFSQQIEGFEKGGSPDGYRTRAIEYLNKVRESGYTEASETVGFREIAKEFDNFIKNSEYILFKDMNVITSNDESIDAVSFLYGIDRYERLAGEVEATNVENRVNMSAEERLNTLLSETQSIPFEDQFISQFKNDTQAILNSPQKIEKEVLDRLKQNGLANNVYQLTTAELNNKLEELGVGNTKQTVNGFVHTATGDIYLNSDLADNSTLIHEYSHIFLDTIEKTRPELYKRGMDLVEEELNKEDSDIKSIIDFVTTNQPSLKGDALKAEILAELTGRRGSELLESLKAKKSGIFDWLIDIWNSVKDMLNLTSVTPEQLSQMTLGEYADAITVDLTMGKKLFEDSVRGQETKFQIIGEKGASRIEEYNNLLNQAKELEKQGATPAEIEKQTLWYKFKGQWRTLPKEILQSFKVVSNTRDKILTLKEVIGDDNVLFKFYPEIDKTKVVFVREGVQDLQTPEDFEDYSGAYDEGSDTIFINTMYEGNEVGEKEEKYTLGHEIQHRIQEVEGFPKGGDYTSILDEALTILNISEDLGPEDTYNRILKADKTNLTDNEKLIVDASLNTVLAIVNDDENLLKNQYKHLLGEIDSKVVEAALKVKDNFNIIPKSYKEMLGYYANIGGVNLSEVFLLRNGNKRFSKTTVEEPQAKFNGYNTYSEALKNTTSNDTIKITIEDEVVAEVSADTSNNTINGSLNDLVKQTILKGERFLNPNGDIVHVTEGNSAAKKFINATIAENLLGRNNTIIDDNSNIILKEKQESVLKLSFDEINKKYKDVETSSAVIAGKLYAENMTPFGDSRVIDSAQEITPENVLQENLLNLLSQLGIKTVSLDRYKASYENRNGVPVTAVALADIANKVIAFSSGQVTQDTLTEEVSHFIIEALDQEAIQPLLDNINKTEEWAEHAQHYFELYGDEAIVRKEVLGKVLSNAIQKGFRQEQTTMVGNSIISKLRAFFEQFLDSIYAMIKPQHTVDLQRFTNEVYRNLMANQLIDKLNKEQLEGNKLVMYQSSATINNETDVLAEKVKKALEYLENQDRKLDSISKTEIEDIKQLQDLDASLQIAKISKRQVDYLRKRNKAKLLSSEEYAVYTSTTTFLFNALTALRGAVSNKQAEQALSETINDITLLRQEVSINQEEIFNDLIDRIVVSPEQKAAVLESFRTLEKDTNWFFQQAGGIIHASNPALNILSAVISDMNVKAKLNFNDRKVSFLNVADKLGFDVNQLPDVLKKFKRGNYIFNAYDFDKAEDDLNEEKARLLNEMFTEEEKKEIGAITKETVKEKENDIIANFKDLERVKNYKYQANQYRLRNQNIPNLKQSEIDAKDKFIEENNISSTALLLDAEFSKKRSNITRQAKKEGGFSQALKALMEELNRDRLFAKNPFNNDGDLRPGLSFDEDGKLQIDVNSATKESILVYELTKLDEYKAKSFKENTGQAPTPTYFYSILESMDRDERREFLELNANISFNNNFWDQFDSNTNQVEDEELAKQIALVSKKRSNILKAYKVFNNPSEVNYTAMNDITKDEVRRLSEQLETLYKEASSKSGKETEDKFFESIVNDAYKKEIRDYYSLRVDETPTVDQVVEFARNHTTLDNKYKLDWARGVFKDFENGRIKQLPKSLQGYNNAAEFAESKLLPYFKKIQPKGFDYEAELNNFLDNPTQGLNSQYLSITPSYIFLEQGENDRVNPEYMKRIENGEPLLNDKYANEEYLKYFGMSSIDAQPTKNLKEYELLKELVVFQEETILSAGMENKHNKYLLPQKEARGLRKIMGADVKGYLRDLTRNREDDAIYGQKTDETKSERQGTYNELIVPRHGFYNIENTTDELLYSYMWMAQQSELTRQRIDALAEVESVRGALLNKQYGDKHGESTRTYKMFDDFVRANIYGQSETFHMDTTLFGLKKDKVNVATSIKSFQSFIRLSNLGFNILTPLTSLLQGSVNYFGEKVVGGRIDKDAERLSRGLMSSMLTESANETFSLVGKGRLSMLNEFMGQGNAQERFENSNYSGVVRGLQKSAYLTHSIADAPLATKVLLTVLHDYRVVGDKIMNFKQFANTSDKSVKELRKEWVTYEKDVIFNYLEVVKDGKYGKYQLKEIPGVDRAYAEKALQQIRNAVTLAKQEVDSAIPSVDRSNIQRHALLSFAALHKNWLATSMTRRFKSRHQNMYSGLAEEGSYTGVGNFLKDVISDMRANGGLKNLRQSLVKTWAEAKNDRVRMESLKRAMFDVAIVNALGLIAILLKNAADDDDEKDNAMLQFSSYMGYRLASEVTSQSTGFPNEAYKFLESPTTGLSQIQNMLDITDLASSDLVKTGKYRGYSTRAAWMFKTLPGIKEVFKLTNMDKTRQTYELFNRSIQNPFFVASYSILEKDKEEEE
jgi:hypothetical protein